MKAEGYRFEKYDGTKLRKLRLIVGDMIISHAPKSHNMIGSIIHVTTSNTVW